jgi:hypothetical protein
MKVSRLIEIEAGACVAAGCLLGWTPLGLPLWVAGAVKFWTADGLRARGW